MAQQFSSTDSKSDLKGILKGGNGNGSAFASIKKASATRTGRVEQAGEALLAGGAPAPTRVSSPRQRGRSESDIVATVERGEKAERRAGRVAHAVAQRDEKDEGGEPGEGGVRMGDPLSERRLREEGTPVLGDRQADDEE